MSVGGSGFTPDAGTQPRQGTAGPWDCLCGYPATSLKDLDAHLLASMHSGDPEGTHQPANR